MQKFYRVLEVLCFILFIASWYVDLKDSANYNLLLSFIFGIKAELYNKKDK